MITLKTPAKINLTLEVLHERMDGFHEIRTVLQTIDLYDTLYIQAGRGFSFRCNMLGWSAEKSLMNRAAHLLSSKFPGGAAIRIEKRIPLLSGLGGDSSDAAALLKGLNSFFKLRISDDALHALAAELGSDAVFFVRGGTALATGRGNIITPLPSPPKLWLVLFVPDFTVKQGKTARMYTALKPSDYTEGTMTNSLVRTLKKGKAVASTKLFNVFENVAFDVYEGLDNFMERLVELGVTDLHLAGSGPTLFSVFNKKSKAEELYRRCLKEGVKVYLSSTL